MKTHFPPDSLLVKGLAYTFRFSENHTFEVFLQWEGKFRWNFYLRKLDSFQSCLTVVHTTTTGAIFRFLALVLYSIKVTLCEEGP
uniref:Uncharacterized protein n=1 Tax=Leviviridae sp. TaxID=2027243 RepID=A0A514DA71_9VIRU|nr:MAG: hypothetical protein H2RhizoLitter491109_000005 [Leviviridae sp.]